MESTLRLNFPEWQGGYDQCFSDLLPEFPEKGISTLKGYSLGSQIMSFIAPKAKGPEVTVPMPETETEKDLETKNGIFAYDACLRNLKSCFEILNTQKPKRVVTIGGECSVSIPPFTYLANEYKDDICIVWIDAHPDINLPGDPYPGYHAMALALCMGMGDEGFIKNLPAKVPVEKCIVVGLRKIEVPAKITKEKIGLKSINPEEMRQDPQKLIQWIESTKAKKVLIHLDLDVLDPQDLYVAVGKEPNGMKLKEVIEDINLIGNKFDIVGLTIAERMPVESIRLQYMMKNLPLFK